MILLISQELYECDGKETHAFFMYKMKLSSINDHYLLGKSPPFYSFSITNCYNLQGLLLNMCPISINITIVLEGFQHKLTIQPSFRQIFE